MGEAVWKVSVLIADDEQPVRELIAEKLRERGWEVWAAPDGIKALELAKTHQPTVIIADYHMPGLDGWELAELLQHDPNTRAIPIILLSGDDATLLRQPIGDRNIQMLIKKPFGIQDIIQAVAAFERQET